MKLKIICETSCQAQFGTQLPERHMKETQRPNRGLFRPKSNGATLNASERQPEEQKLWVFKGKSMGRQGVTCLGITGLGKRVYGSWFLKWLVYFRSGGIWTWAMPGMSWGGGASNTYPGPQSSVPAYLGPRHFPPVPVAGVKDLL